MGDDRVRFTLHLEVNIAAGVSTEEEIEVDRAEWEAMTQVGRQAYVDECADDLINNSVSVGAEFENPDDEPQF